jgi:hypothetical protein
MVTSYRVGTRRIRRRNLDAGARGDAMRRNRNPTKPVFSDASIKSIVDALPRNCRAERAALLPEVLLAWGKEDLLEHLSRESRAAAKRREEQRRSVGAQARELIGAFVALDETGFLDTAIRLQMGRAGTSMMNTDIRAACQRSNGGISWIIDLAEVLSDPSHTQGSDREPKVNPEPVETRRKKLGPVAIQSYLIILDLAGIFKLVSGTQPTRRTTVNPSKDYGPFWEFTRAAWSVIFDNERGLSAAVKYWDDEMMFQCNLAQAVLHKATTCLGRDLTNLERRAVERRFGAYSTFVANMQFRHPDLWQKLREPR